MITIDDGLSIVKISTRKKRVDPKLALVIVLFLKTKYNNFVSDEW